MGHFGSQAIVNRIKLSGFSWTRLLDDALETVKSCPLSQRFNISKRGYHPLTPITASLPFDHVCLDLLGPSPTSASGYNYVLVHIDLN
jgi:hypothetical protein